MEEGLEIFCFLTWISGYTGVTHWENALILNLGSVPFVYICVIVQKYLYKKTKQPPVQRRKMWPMVWRDVSLVEPVLWEGTSEARSVRLLFTLIFERIVGSLLVSFFSSKRGRMSLEVPRIPHGSTMGIPTSERAHLTTKPVACLHWTTGRWLSLTFSQRWRLLPSSSDRFLGSLTENYIRIDF